MPAKPQPSTDTPLPRTIGRPATNAFAVVGITRLEDLTRYTEKELLDLHGVGPKAIRILKEVLQERGLSLRSAK